MKVVIVAIMVIGALEAIALTMGVDGILLTTAVGTIAGLTGLYLKTPRILKKEVY